MHATNTIHVAGWVCVGPAKKETAFCIQVTEFQVRHHTTRNETCDWKCVRKKRSESSCPLSFPPAQEDGRPSRIKKVTFRFGLSDFQPRESAPTELQLSGVVGVYFVGRGTASLETLLTLNIQLPYMRYTLLTLDSLCKDKYRITAVKRITPRVPSENLPNLKEFITCIKAVISFHVMSPLYGLPSGRGEAIRGCPPA